jgi:hypothetical protein
MSEQPQTPVDPTGVDNPTSRLPHEPAEIAQQELEAFRRMSFAERGRLLAIACRAGARLDRSRREAGLPEPVPEPWPESTWVFLKRQTAIHNARSRRTS